MPDLPSAGANAASMRVRSCNRASFLSLAAQSDGTTHSVRPLDAAAAGHARAMGAAEVAAYARRAGEGQRALAAAAAKTRITQALARAHLRRGSHLF